MSILTPNSAARRVRLVGSMTAGLLTIAAVGASVASAQSLGDIAKKEEARRKATATSGKVYSNDGLRPEPTPRSTSAPPPAATPAKPPASTPGAAGSKSSTSTASDASAAGEKGAPADEGKRDEAYWRERLKNLQEAQRRSRLFADALQSRINGLTADFTARHDPIQRAAIATDREGALAELDRVKKEIQQQDKALADAQEEARRAGVPAGWLRE
jgi:hypothetical protein